MLRREVPTLIGFFFGMTMIVNYFVPWRPMGNFAGDVQQWALIVTAFAYVLGGLNILGIHANKIQRRARDWGYSVVTVAALLVMLVLGFMPVSWGGGKGQGTPLVWIFDATYVPLGSTVFSLLAFYIASASFRAFRIRSWQAASLAITAVVVMLAAVPLTTSLLAAISPGLGEAVALFRSWIMDALQNAGKRAILIGVALGSISTGIKIILGIERPYGRD
jgi:hypothetical protein